MYYKSIMIALVDVCKKSIYKVTMKSATNAIWTKTGMLQGCVKMLSTCQVEFQSFYNKPYSL